MKLSEIVLMITGSEVVGLNLSRVNNYYNKWMATYPHILDELIK